MGDAKNVIRSGRISSINPENGTARVVFADKDNLVSYDLPVLQRSTLKNKDYGMPDIGESVVCLFQPNGIAEGFVVGAHYNEEDVPPVTDPDVRMVKFEDGTVVSYNRFATNTRRYKRGQLSGSLHHIDINGRRDDRIGPAEKRVGQKPLGRLHVADHAKQGPGFKYANRHFSFPPYATVLTKIPSLRSSSLCVA